MSRAGLRFCSWAHKWTSLVCMVFMLLLCLTGLPLIFQHEISDWLGKEVEAPALPAGTPQASLDQVLAAAQSLHPDRVLQFASRPDEGDALWFVTLTPTPAPTQDFKSIAVDARSAAVLSQRPVDQGLMYVLLRLHVDLFAGLAGKLLLGAMGLLLLLSIVTGLLLYAPFMRKLHFGTLRRGRSARLEWLDLHNLLGVGTLVWALVVAATGALNTCADLLLEYWQHDQLAALSARYAGQSAVAAADRAPMQRALDAAQAQTPGMRLAFIAFPGTAFSSPQHHAFYMRGSTPLSARLLQPVLVDARSAQVSAAPERPWYLSALLLSQPLHFGDYGGMPMKILWALLDVATIVVLLSGIVLWLRRGAVAGAGDGVPAPGRRAASACRSADTKTERRAETGPPFLRLWGWPLSLALLTATGLLSALLSEHWGDWWSWFGLGLPLAVIGWFTRPRARPAR